MWDTGTQTGTPGQPTFLQMKKGGCYIQPTAAVGEQAFFEHSPMQMTSYVIISRSRMWLFILIYILGLNISQVRQ